jgi:hypothetical protein
VFGVKFKEYKLESKIMRDMEKKSYELHCLAELETFRFSYDKRNS